MATLEELIQLAEDELAQYSTDARKIEKLRRRLAFMTTPDQRQQYRAELMTELSDRGWNRLIEDQRQAVALPFWGIAGLGLLFGISFMQPQDLIATAVAGAIALTIQKRGWALQARRLLLKTFDDLDTPKASA
jgi:hypothetical protein